MEFIGPVQEEWTYWKRYSRGVPMPQRRALGRSPPYYWQPYGCNYVLFGRSELRRFFFFFEGDSLMLTLLNGLMATFMKLL